MFFVTKRLFVISDVDLVKEITVKQFDKFVNRLVSASTTCVYVYICCFIFLRLCALK